jgi:hypothetical protein
VKIFNSIRFKFESEFNFHRTTEARGSTSAHAHSAKRNAGFELKAAQRSWIGSRIRAARECWLDLGSERRCLIRIIGFPEKGAQISSY